MKFDGYRGEVAVAGSGVLVYTRNGHDWTRQFKVILPPLQALTKGSALIDGEIVAIDSHGRTNFSMLKTGIAAGMPLKFYAFDLLELNGDDLSNRPLLQRKEQLESLLGTRDPDDSLQFSGHIVDHGKEVFDAMCEGGHEGVIAKRADSRYIGDRTASWLKIKCTKRQEFVVGGYRPSDTGRGMASLILGTYENGELIYRGRVDVIVAVPAVPVVVIENLVEDDGAAEDDAARHERVLPVVVIDELDGARGLHPHRSAAGDG